MTISINPNDIPMSNSFTSFNKNLTGIKVADENGTKDNILIKISLSFPNELIITINKPTNTKNIGTIRKLTSSALLTASPRIWNKIKYNTNPNTTNKSIVNKNLRLKVLVKNVHIPSG